MKIVNNEGIELNSEYRIDSIQDVLGLILESWGPSARNPDYNVALELILSRLKDLHVQYLFINVISKSLIKAFPEFQRRSIMLDSVVNSFNSKRQYI